MRPSVAASASGTVPGGPCVVATACPRCGAPLDFAEASNAVRCDHCASVLLVTGRRRVLSYGIAPRIAPSEARALAGFTRPAGAGRLGAARLVLVPYYRLTAEEIYWHVKTDAPPREDRTGLADVDARLAAIAVASLRARAARRDVEIGARRLERNFLARDLGGRASWSLGFRPSVLRLELFQRAPLSENARILAPTVTPQQALARALEPVGEIELVCRDVLRAILSLVYFPFWWVEAETTAGTRLTVVDAVSGAIVERDADPLALDDGPGGVRDADRVLGFRPLCCPNCGWDLPVRPDDVVFHCASCERTWELVGEDLEQVPSVVVAGGERAGCTERYLPVWQVDGEVGARDAGAAVLPQRLFAPAFRYPGLKALCDLGLRLARKNPRLAPHPGAHLPLVGCSLDRRDAVTLARLVALRLLIPTGTGLGREPRAPEVTVAPRELRLVWLPFAGDAYSLREPFCGSALPRRALDAALAPESVAG